jgi:hypothetical protein
MLGAWFVLPDAAALVAHNLIEIDHELRRTDAAAFWGQIPLAIALIPAPPADTVPARLAAP